MKESARETPHDAIGNCAARNVVPLYRLRAQRPSFRDAKPGKQLSIDIFWQNIRKRCIFAAGIIEWNV